MRREGDVEINDDDDDDAMEPRSEIVMREKNIGISYSNEKASVGPHKTPPQRRDDRVVETAPVTPDASASLGESSGVQRRIRRPLSDSQLSVLLAQQPEENELEWIDCHDALDLESEYYFYRNNNFYYYYI